MSAPKPENLKPLLATISDAQRMLSVSRSAVYALIASGRLPRVKIGRSARFRVSDIEKLVDEAR